MQGYYQRILVPPVLNTLLVDIATLISGRHAAVCWQGKEPEANGSTKHWWLRTTTREFN
jgi:hypothetical protein